MGISISPYLNAPFPERRDHEPCAVGVHISVAAHAVPDFHYIDAVAVEVLPTIGTPARCPGWRLTAALALYTSVSRNSERAALGLHTTA